LGVNITFFPQHFLGLNGIPRRYSEYPDIFINFNLIRSIGSIISSLSRIMFIFLIFESLVRRRFLLYLDFQNSINDYYSGILPNDHTFRNSTLILY
jgi:heme/copper-type cytochrome/quinol oxidase subunit 1